MENQCGHCYKFCTYEEMDIYIPFGCSDPESPEPYEPTSICAKCSDELYHDFIKRFERGDRRGDWQKSNAERRAAGKMNLVWIHNSERLELNGRRLAYEYIPLETYNVLTKGG